MSETKAGTEREKLRVALMECRNLFAAIRQDWEDPRTECRVGIAAIDAALNVAPEPPVHCDGCHRTGKCPACADGSIF